MSEKDKRPPVGMGAGNAAFGKAAKSSEDYTILEAALFYIPAGDRNIWLRMGMAVKSELGDGGFDLWDEWSRTADNYDLKAARTTWRSITQDGGVTLGTLYHEAQRHGFRFNGETRPQPPTAEEIAERDRGEQENEGARQRAQENAAKKAEGILEAATGDPKTHPYAVKKRVPLGAFVKRGPWPQRGWNDALLVPIYGVEGRMQSIEAINSEPDADGEFPRDSVKHGKKIGGFYPLGNVRGALRMFIAEGIATAAVGAEVDKSPAVAAMGKSNLLHVALAARELAAPDADLIILADNDVKPDGSNPGLKAANEAAAAVGGRVAIPNLSGRKCDFWDVWNELGIDAVRNALANAQTPEEDDPAQDTGNATGGIGEQKNSMPLVSLLELLNEPDEDVGWIVDELLPAGGFSIVAAKPKVGKTTLCRSMALAVAQGAPFLGRHTQQGAVVYIALEEKRGELRKAFRALGATGREPIYLHIASAPADVLAQTRAAIDQHRPLLVIIDTLFRFAHVRDANDYAQVTEALTPLLDMARKTGAHVCCTHHAPKGEREGGDAILGSTAIFGSVDTAIVLKRAEKHRTLYSVQRYGADLEETILSFNSDTGAVSLGSSRQAADVGEVKVRIVEFLRGVNDAPTEADIVKAVEGRTIHKRAALRQLFEQGTITRSGKGGRGDPYRYTCSDSCSDVPHI